MCKKKSAREYNSFIYSFFIPTTYFRHGTSIRAIINYDENKTLKKTNGKIVLLKYIFQTCGFSVLHLALFNRDIHLRTILYEKIAKAGRKEKRRVVTRYKCTGCYRWSRSGNEAGMNGERS